MELGAAGYFGIHAQPYHRLLRTERMPVLELGLSDPLSRTTYRHRQRVSRTTSRRWTSARAGCRAILNSRPVSSRASTSACNSPTMDNALRVLSSARCLGGVTQRGAIADLMTPANLGNSFDQVPGGIGLARQSDFYTYDMAALIARTGPIASETRPCSARQRRFRAVRHGLSVRHLAIRRTAGDQRRGRSAYAQLKHDDGGGWPSDQH